MTDFLVFASIGILFQESTTTFMNLIDQSGSDASLCVAGCTALVLIAVEGNHNPESLVPHMVQGLFFSSEQNINLGRSIAGEDRCSSFLLDLYGRRRRG